MVCHFYRGATWRCQVIDRHLGDLAPAHPETRFVKIDAEKSPYLVEKLGVVVLPSVLCIKNGKVVHTIVGFDEFGGADEFGANKFSADEFGADEFGANEFDADEFDADEFDADEFGAEFGAEFGPFHFISLRTFEFAKTHSF